MLKNYLKIAYRNIFKNKVYSFINIFGLAVGLAATILITLWVADEISFNNFNKNIDQIYAIPQTQHYKNMGDFTVIPTPTALAPFLKTNYPEFKYATRFTAFSGKKPVGSGKNIFRETVKYIDPDFFKIFSFNFIKGNPDNALAEPNSIVITKEVAEKHFGRTDVLGNTLRIDGKNDFKITGVIANIPENSDIQFEILASMKAMDNFHADLNNWGSNRLVTYVLLKKGISYKAESKKIGSILQQHLRGASTAGNLFLFPFKDYHLHSISGSGGKIKIVILFSIIALIILLIACINFMNLTTARASKRAMEVGIKKVIGAGRFQIAKQFFSETILLTFISLIFALLIVEAFLPLFNIMADKNLSLLNLSFNSFLLIIGITILTGIISGLYPALYLSSFRPIQILSKAANRKSGHFAFRRMLVVFQFGISIFLIIGTIVMSKQLSYLINKNLGFDKQNIIYFSVNNSIKPNLASMKSELLRDTKVSSVSSTSSIPYEIYNNGGGITWKGKDPNREILISFFGLDYDFTKTFNVKMKKGRFFSHEFAADTSDNIVINETFAKIIGKENVIGTTLNAGGSQHFNIIGVMKDFNFTHLNSKTGPLFMSVTNSPQYIFVKTSSNLPDAVTNIKNIYEKFSGGLPFKYHFLDRSYELSFKSETRLSKIFNNFTLLAIIISCLGLFGLASFVAEQKTKEIGIRKVLGASTFNIVKKLTTQFLIWVLIANIIAWPIAYYYLNKWLQSYPYRISLNIWLFVAAGCIALLIAFITVSFQAIKAAWVNPVKSLKYE